MFPKTLPSTKKELFSRLRGVIAHKWYEMPESPRCNGTGAPGNFLEDLLGLTAGNKDVPDSCGWEIKFYTAKTHLITLFHKEPSPEKVMRLMVSRWGITDEKGRKSFRHTIAGRSDKFVVVDDSSQVIVRPIKGNGLVASWTHDDILNIAGAKLRRLVLVKGQRDGNRVCFERADCFEDLHLTLFVWELVAGTICIDFDAREASPGSVGLRNHGTKFRIPPENVCRVYMKKERFS